MAETRHRKQAVVWLDGPQVASRVIAMKLMRIRNYENIQRVLLEPQLLGFQ
jgi:hypothetical protein